MYHDTYCGIVKKEYLKSWGKMELSILSIFEKRLKVSLATLDRRIAEYRKSIKE